MVLFHSSVKSPRLNYVLDYIFRQRLNIPYSVSSENLSPKSTELLIHYGKDSLESAWNIPSEGLLEARGLTKDQTDFLDFVNKPLDFNHCTFDVLSAIFYHLSRYEEYLGNAEDEHGRYSWKNSSISAAGLLELPFVDEWVNQIKLRIKEKITDYSNPDQYRVLPSMDIDSVFAYKGRSFLRQGGAMFRDLLNFNGYELYKRSAVLFLGQKDPNDNFMAQAEMLEDRKMTYFVQVSDYSRFDKNVSHQNKEFVRIIRQLKENGHRIGLHPGYNTHLSEEAIRLEKLRLSNMLASDIDISRQHFLRMKLPETYRLLIQCGIREDHSMGYSEVPGFRAGTAFPFLWYDLDNESSSELTIVPFSAMDVAYKQFMGFDPLQTVNHSANIRKTLKKLSAPFSFVFHNESLSGHRGWENWNLVFKDWLNE